MSVVDDLESAAVTARVDPETIARNGPLHFALIRRTSSAANPAATDG